MAAAFEQDIYVQIDVKEIKDDIVICNMYTGVSCTKITMSKSEYTTLVRKGFFLRNGNEVDSAGVRNTTESFYLKKDLQIVQD